VSEGGYARPALPPAPLKLDLNEAPWDADGLFRQRFLAFLQRAELRRYPPQDAWPAREAAAQLYGWRPEGTLVGNGSNELLAAALATFAGSGKKVLAFAPSFSVYPWLVRRAGGELVAVPLLPPTFAIPEEALLQAAEGADFLLLCSPNNPTGGEISPALWHKVLALGKPTLWDGAYWEFGRLGPKDVATSSAAETGPPEGEVAYWLASYPNLMITRTLSKVWGVAAVRAGCLLAGPELVARVSRTLLPFAPGVAVWAAFAAAASMPEVGTRRAVQVRACREEQLQALACLGGVEVVPSYGNFFLLRVPGLLGEQLAELLARQGVSVRPVPELSAEGYVRITVGTREEGERLVQAVQEVAHGIATGKS
jgi:histidinol-phosphate aminotransferase